MKNLLASKWNSLFPRPGTGLLLLLAVLCLPASVSAQPQPQPQPQPHAAAVASAHPIATRAGMEILAAGGNAFDAAVTGTAVLAVVEPYSSGLGGGGFWLLHVADTGRDVMIDGRERAPLAATRDMYLDQQGEFVPGLSMDGPLAAGIPGVPAAIVHLAERYGKLPLERTLASAIRVAREGFPVDEHYREMARFRLTALQQDPESANLFLDENRVPETGYQIRQDSLADTLAALAETGWEGFYAGPVARRLVAAVQVAGGIWTMDDLAGYQVIERVPVTGAYHGWKITSAPPPSSGGIGLLSMLNILEGFPLAELDAATRTHVIVEAMRRAYRDRAEYLGDPDFVEIPLSRLTDPAYAAGLRASIRLDRATPSDFLPGSPGQTGGQDTTHFSIIDSDGNRVAATLSINYPFGACFTPVGTGVLLNNEMDDFSAKPGVPNAYGLVGAEANAIAPGKRPLSSMTPSFLEDENGVAILGTPGGSRIITMVLLGVLDAAAGNGPESWVRVPRFHHQFLPDVIRYEREALDDETVTALEERGHVLDVLEHSYGNMQAVYLDKKSNQVTAASDPRGIGSSQVQAIE